MNSCDHSSSHSAADTAGILLDTFNVQLNTANLTTGVQISHKRLSRFQCFQNLQTFSIHCYYEYFVRNMKHLKHFNLLYSLLDR